MHKSVTKLIALFGTLAITGCNTANVISLEQTGSVNAPAVQSLSMMHKLAPESALLAFQHNGPRTTRVNQRLYKNGLKQKIVFANNTAHKGENFLELRLVEGANQRNINDEISLHANSDQEIYNQFVTFFPGHKPRIENRVFQNQYGAYGLSFFRMSGHEGCMMAWQKSSVGTVDPKAFSNSARIENLSYHMRYCENGLNLARAEQIMQSVSIRYHGYMADPYASNTYNQYSDPYQNTDYAPQYQPAPIAQPYAEPYSQAPVQPYVERAADPSVASYNEPVVVKRKSKKIKKRIRKAKAQIREKTYSDFPVVPLPE